MLRSLHEHGASMKTIKPFRLSVMPRPFRWLGGNRLGIAVIALVDLSGPRPMLRPDIELWQCVNEDLAAQGVLDLAVPKPEAEFLVAGRAYTRHQDDKTQCAVRVRVGDLEKQLLVFGDRYWLDGKMTAPSAFDDMPLDWGRSYGGPGWAENPQGIGHVDEIVNGVKTRRVPNIEHPLQRLHRAGQPVAPAGLGPVDFTWPRRFALAGTYSERWLQTDFPGFFPDMDARIFNAAEPDQRWAGRDSLPPGAPFEAWNLHPEKVCWRGHLPDWQARCFVNLDRGDRTDLVSVPLRATTAWLIPHRESVIMIYHGAIDVIEDDGADVLHIMPALEAPGATHSLDHYVTTFEQRANVETAAAYIFRDRDLVPAEAIGAWVDGAQAETGPMQRNLEAWRLKCESDARAMIERQGLDSNDYLPQRMGPDKPFDLDQLPAIMAQSEQMKVDAEAELNEAREGMQARAREMKAQGVDFGAMDVDKLSDIAASGVSGPPTFNAERAQQALVAAIAASGRVGDPMHDAAVARAGGAEQRRSFVQAEQSLRKVYLYSVQFQAGVARLAQPAALAVRERVAAIYADTRDFGGMDLTGADLSGMTLSGARFVGAQLEGADLSDADFQGADFTEAVLARAVMRGTRWDGVDFSRANLSLSQAQGASFVGATFDAALCDESVWTQCIFDGARFKQNILRGLRWSASRFHGAQFDMVFWFEHALTQLDFAAARWSKSGFYRCTLTGCGFEGAQLTDCSFMASELANTDFSRARMTTTAFVVNTALDGCRFDGAHLTQCTLRDLSIKRASFHDAVLDTCDFSNADMTGASLRQARAPQSMFVRTTLRDTDCLDASLIGTSFQKADIRGANFSRANLFRADLSQTQVNAATLTQGAYMTELKTLPQRAQEGQA